jgi:hypothetical protein
MRKSNKKTPPLPIGTRVQIDIAQGMDVAKGVIRDAEYDDGWSYRVDVTGGDDCREHRDQAGELWVCDFEVHPLGKRPATSKRQRGATVEAKLLAIAQSVLGVVTLESRHSDRLDFYELGVGQIKDALQAAYEAGRASKK